MKQFTLEIAGFYIVLKVDGTFSHFHLPQSYLPFLVEDDPGQAPLFTLRVIPGSPAAPDGLTPVATGINDMGEARLFVHPDGTYAVALSIFPGSGTRLMNMNADFTEASVILDPAEAYAAFTIDSMMRIMFSQAVVAHRAFLLHASAVIASGCAALFMGRSGTGKSTHSSLWLEQFSDTSLLNDDNPVVRILPNGVVMAYGSPWSGKTPCYRNASAPVSALVRLRQAPHNKISVLSDLDAFLAILPGVSVITHSPRLYDTACSTVADVAAATRVALLDCRPDTEAARLCRNTCIV